MSKIKERKNIGSGEDMPLDKISKLVDKLREILTCNKYGDQIGFDSDAYNLILKHEVEQDEGKDAEYERHYEFYKNNMRDKELDIDYFESATQDLKKVLGEMMDNCGCNADDTAPCANCKRAESALDEDKLLQSDNKHLHDKAKEVREDAKSRKETTELSKQLHDLLVHDGILDRDGNPLGKSRKDKDVEKLEIAGKIMQKFVDKVDSGRAISTETYNECKDWLGKDGN